MIISNGFSEVT